MISISLFVVTKTAVEFLFFLPLKESEIAAESESNYPTKSTIRAAAGSYPTAATAVQ
jgi:hypothetical protein